MSGVVGTMEVTGFMQLKMGYVCSIYVSKDREVQPSKTIYRDQAITDHFLACCEHTEHLNGQAQMARK